MPRVTRKPKQRRDSYGEEHVRMLLRGVYLHRCPFGTNYKAGPMVTQALKDAWHTLRDDLLRQWTREKPGTRPYAWWLLEAPEPRRRVDGIVHPFDDRVRRQRIEEIAKVNPDFQKLAYELYYGRPRIQFAPVDFGAQYETEAEYLYRLELLTDAERKELFE